MDWVPTTVARFRTASFASVTPELTISPLVVPCVMMFAALVGLEHIEAPAVGVCLYGAPGSLKSVDTLAMLPVNLAVDGYCMSFAMIGNTDRLLGFAERVARVEDHDPIVTKWPLLSGTVRNAETKIAALAQLTDVIL